MTTTQRTNRQLAELIVGTMISMRRMQGLYAAAAEVERVCDLGLPLADMLVKGLIRSVTADGREQLGETWDYVLRNVPSGHVAELGIDRNEWRAANDTAAGYSQSGRSKVRASASQISPTAIAATTG